MEKSLNMTYHNQENSFYCGPACAQMILEYFKVPLTNLDQDRLFSDGGAFSSPDDSTCWSTTPEGMAGMVNSYLPAGASLDLLIEQPQLYQTRSLLWSICHDNTPGIALINNAAHWVVVSGFEVDKLPSKFADYTPTIESIWILNPEPTFIIVNIGTPSIGLRWVISDRHVSYACWLDHVFTPVWVTCANGLQSPRNSKYISVCTQYKTITYFPPQERKFPIDLWGIIPKEKAMQQAMRGLEQYKMFEKSRLQDRLHNIRPGNPVLVKSLHKYNDYHYVVPMVREENEITGLVCVDAVTGEYRESGYAMGTEMAIEFRELTKDEIYKILGEKIMFKRPGKMIKIFPQAVTINEMLVWRPCLESSSPYHPFHMIHIGNETVYIRLDGKLFTELTLNQGGL